MKEMKLSRVGSILLGIILVIGISAISYAAIPETMSYQGYLTDLAGDPVNGTVEMTFRIYDSADPLVVPVGSQSWIETHTLVQVNQGVYSVQLGSVSTLAVPGLTFDVPYWLGVEVETDGEMDPRQPFDSVPFAVISAMAENATSAEYATSAGSASSADFASSVADGSVNDNSITGTISSSKIEYLGLNADFIDDMDSTDFANVSHIHGSADITQGSGSTLDADLLDGQDSAAFANTSHSHGSADITPPLSFLSDNGITIQTTSTHINGTGIRGEGNFMGVAGYTQGDTGVGVYGLSGTTGANYGVFGYSRSPDGHGVHGMNDAGGYAGYFDGPVATTGNVTSGGTVTASSFSGSGVNITNLNASNLTTGTVADSQLSANVDLLDADQSITGVKNFAPVSGTVPFTVDVSKIGPVAYLNADLLDGQHSSDIIAAASDEVRTPISACGTTISTSGSYYVTQNLSTTGTCITITASNVTLDLMGFTLSGSSVANDHGVYIVDTSNVEVKNGTVMNFDTGIRTYQSGSPHSNRAINIRAIGNIGVGISMGASSLVKDCTASYNGSNGLGGGDGSTVINNTASYNGGNGISAGFGATVANNTAFSNTNSGINVGHGATLINNTAYSNQFHGIHAYMGSTIKNNSTHNNSQYGIRVDSNSLVDGNTSYGNTWANLSPCSPCTFGLNHAP